MYRLSTMFIGFSALVATAFAQPADYGYDLEANTPFAHVINGGPVADASRLGFAKYVRDLSGRWTVNQPHKGRPAALIPGLQGHFWLPRGGELPKQNLAIEFMLDPLGSDQRLDVFVSGKKVAHKVFESGWQTHTVKIPGNLLVAPDVHVRLHFRRTISHKGKKTPAAIRYIRLKAASRANLPSDEAALSDALNYGGNGQLRITKETGLDWFLVPAKNSKLVSHVTGDPISVLVQTDKGSRKTLASGAGLSADLSKYAGQPIRLMLRSSGNTVLTGGQITGGQPGQPQAKNAPKYVVFWLIDTLRADKLNVYEQRSANGRPKPRTPNLDALAKEATVFQNFWVQGNESKASHASLFTGTYPAVHKVFDHKANLPDKLTTLAEAFTKNGYLSGGYVSNGYISDRWNFAQGFNKRVFINNIRKGRANNARAILRDAKPFIDKYKKKPFYLYLGTSDPHVTYRRHKKLIRRYDNKPYSGRYQKNITGGELGKLKGKKNAPSKRDQERIEALYENEIEFNDIYFGKLVAHLKKPESMMRR